MAFSCSCMEISDIHYIDQSSITSKADNFLFRGPYADDPDTGEWSQDVLIQGLQITAEKENVTLPETFIVGDLSLLTVEWDALYSEAQFYLDNPDLGFFSHWPQFGTNLNASDLDENTRNYVADFAPQPYGDYLEMLMDLLPVWLATPSEESVVYYIHCQSGKDRTGQVSAAYYIRWLGATWNDAMYYDQSCVGENRELSPPLACGAQWYCYQLNNTKSTGDCLAQVVEPSDPCTLPHPNKR